MNLNIVPIGVHCNISFSLRHLGVNKPTGLFEWFECQSVDAVTEVIRSLENSTYTFTSDEYCTQLLTNAIYSYHYKNGEFDGKFQRRVGRLINQLNEREVIFIRIDRPGIHPTNARSVIELASAVHALNPGCKITYLQFGFQGNDFELVHFLETAHVKQLYVNLTNTLDYGDPVSWESPLAFTLQRIKSTLKDLGGDFPKLSKADVDPNKDI